MCMRMTEAEPMDLPQMMTRRAAPTVGERQRKERSNLAVLRLDRWDAHTDYKLSTIPIYDGT